MINDKQRHSLLNLNRLMIYGFGLLGLFFDYTWAYVISMTLWVWLPNCIHWEKYVIEQWRNRLMNDTMRAPHSKKHHKYR